MLQFLSQARSTWHQFAAAPSSHVWQHVLVKQDAVVSSACHTPHRGKTADRLRVAADLRVEERKRPCEDVVFRGNVEPVCHARECNQPANPGEARHADLRFPDRSDRVRRPADAEER
ncbi:MAG: hypothetical protein ABFD82_07620, partial [Syntrophaceae bacterium]